MCPFPSSTITGFISHLTFSWCSRTFAGVPAVHQDLINLNVCCELLQSCWAWEQEPTRSTVILQIPAKAWDHLPFLKQKFLLKWEWNLNWVLVQGKLYCLSFTIWLMRCSPHLTCFCRGVGIKLEWDYLIICFNYIYVCYWKDIDKCWLTKCLAPMRWFRIPGHFAPDQAVAIHWEKIILLFIASLTDVSCFNNSKFCCVFKIHQCGRDFLELKLAQCQGW